MASEAAQEGIHQINTMMSDELKSTSRALKKSKDHSRLQDRTSKLQKEVERLRLKTFCAPGQCLRIAEAAALKAVSKFKARSNTWRIKCPDGQTENWVHVPSCRLIVKFEAVQNLMENLRVNRPKHNIELLAGCPLVKEAASLTRETMLLPRSWGMGAGEG